MTSTPEFVKDKRTGVVINVGGDFDKYQQKKMAAKTLINTKKELDTTRREMSELKSEMREIKDLLKTLVNRNS